MKRLSTILSDALERKQTASHFFCLPPGLIFHVSLYLAALFFLVFFKPVGELKVKEKMNRSPSFGFSGCETMKQDVLY